MKRKKLCNCHSSFLRLRFKRITLCTCQCFSLFPSPQYFWTAVAHKCHGKRKNLPAKEKHPRQKRNARGKKEIGHGKRKKFPAKEKLPRQKKNARGKKEIGHGKRKKLPAKEKLPRGKKEISAAKEKCSRQKEIGHGKREIPAAK